MDGFSEALERYHSALREFMKGDSAPVQLMFSTKDDVVLCNPLRPFAQGPDEVADTLQHAASHFTSGSEVFEPVASFATADLAYIVEIERFTAILVDGTESSGALRVTMIFRREDEGWKVAHRHADPISEPSDGASSK
jgi:ketosteroid isomerase-like protein